GLSGGAAVMAAIEFAEGLGSGKRGLCIARDTVKRYLSMNIKIKLNKMYMKEGISAKGGHKIIFGCLFLFFQLNMSNFDYNGNIKGVTAMEGASWCLRSKTSLLRMYLKLKV